MMRGVLFAWRFCGLMLAWLTLSIFTCLASPRPAAIFGDNAVLQRDTPLVIWGWASSGETVRVTYGEQSASAKADSDGAWRVQLPPLPMGAAKDLVFEGETKVVSSNVIVGDVWLCSGQSNMAWEMKQSLGRQCGAEEIIAQARVSEIRQFRGSVHVEFPEKPRQQTDAKWVVLTPETCQNFTAVGYLFARELFDRSHVPQGIVCNAVAGTFIESWMSAEALAAAGIQEEMQQRWQQKLADYPQRKVAYDQAMQAWNDARSKSVAEGKPFTGKKPAELVGPGHRDTPSGCFNAMMSPILPVRLKGMIWYQGEQNIGRALKYGDLLHAYWNDLRAKLEQPNLPILYVQLPNLVFNGSADSTEWAVLRQAQANAQKEPNVYMAVAIDQGLLQDIHPPDKRELARRLALLARREIYKEADIVDRAPLPLSAKKNGLSIRLTFDGAVLLKEPKYEGRTFELAGEDKRFSPAQVTQEGADSVLLRCDAVRSPHYIRYLWSNAPASVLYGDNALPVAPFEWEIDR